jgi:hypothetical protein
VRTDRFVICHSPEMAVRDEAVRGQLVAHLRSLIEGSDAWPARRRDEFVGSLSVTRTMKYLAIDQKVIDLVEARPEKFSTGHLEVLADYASPSTKGAWRMTPKEQLAAAEVLVHQTDKAVVADPRKLEGHIRQLVKKRRDEPAAEKKAARARPQADPVKALFRAIEGLEASVKN